MPLVAKPYSRPCLLRSASTPPRELPLLVAVIAFVCGSLLTTLLHPALLPASPLLRARGTGPPSAAAQLPAALRWYTAAYENPWQFSVSRTGMGELQAAQRRVLARDGRMPRVVVSFTSLPGRFAKYARPMVALLKRQTYVPDRIYVAIPRVARRSNATFRVPTWLARDPLVTVLRPRVDYGPATKLIPALVEEKRLGNEAARIVTVDDDNEGGWTEATLLHFVAYSLAYEDAAIGQTGWNATCMVPEARCGPEDSGVPLRQFRGQWYNFIKQADDYACHSLLDWKEDYFANCMGAVRKNYIAYADVLEGYRGALYQPRFFDVGKVRAVMDKKETAEVFMLCDDVWFSGWLSLRGVKRIVINSAIDEDSEFAAQLAKARRDRGVPESLELLPESKADRAMAERAEKGGGEVEKGLHSMGLDFVTANHEGVKWFAKKGGWVQGMWERPAGFEYPSEREEGGRDER